MPIYLGTPGNDTLSGTDWSDSFDISQGGSDTVTALGDYDQIWAEGAFSPGDVIDGGASERDSVVLRGDYSAGLVISASMVTNIE